MTTYPALPRLSDDTSKSVKDAFGALESWLKKAQAAGGFVTMQKMLDSGYPLAADPAYHATGGVLVLPVADGVMGIDVIEELYATLKPGEYLSRLLVSWLGNGISLFQAELLQDGIVIMQTTTAYSHCRFEGVVAGSYLVRVRKAEVRIITGSGDWSVSNVTVGGEMENPEPAAQFVVYLPDNSPTVRMTWLPSPAVDLAGYRISSGESWDHSITIVNLGKVTECSWSPYTPVSSGHFWIVAVDYGGRESVAVQSETMTIVGPTFDPRGVSAEVLDNTVLLRWQPATQGSYPVDHYEVRRSDPSSVPFEAAASVGRVGGTFSAVYEQQAGGRKYWVQAVDAAGMSSDPFSVYATVMANDFFQLYDQRVSAFGGAVDHARVGNTGTLAAPVELTTSYSTAFGASGDNWLEAVALDAGDAWYAQPGAATGSYEEIVTYLPDSGPTLNFQIIMDVTRRSSGTVTIVPNIQVRALSTDGWTNLGDFYDVQPSIEYRQVKYRLSFTGVGGGVCEVTRLAMRLQSKKLTRTGAAAVSGSDVAGTIVYLTDSGTISGNHWFKALTTIQLTPVGTTRLTAVWDVGPDPGPDHFHIYLFDAVGARAGGEVSWSVSGV